MVKKKMVRDDEKSTLIMSDELLQKKIYVVRGQKVMLDYDLAEIYGYTTKAFNQQVSRNIEKFEGEDFMFRLTWEEIDKLSRSHFVTTMSHGVSNINIIKKQAAEATCLRAKCQILGRTIQQANTIPTVRIGRIDI